MCCPMYWFMIIFWAIQLPQVFFKIFDVIHNHHCSSFVSWVCNNSLVLGNSFVIFLMAHRCFFPPIYMLFFELYLWTLASNPKSGENRRISHQQQNSFHTTSAKNLSPQSPRTQSIWGEKWACKHYTTVPGACAE